MKKVKDVKKEVEEVKEEKIDYKRIVEKSERPFAVMLKKLRERCNVSQGELAEAADTTRQTISHYESGETIPDVYSAGKIIKYFNDKHHLNYTVEYWSGEEEVSKGIKRKELPISNEAIEILKKHEKSDIEIVALEMMLKQKEYWERLAKYIIYGSINSIINKDELFCDFLKIVNVKKPRKIDERYSYYDIQEELPLLKKYAEMEIRKELKDNTNVLYEYVDFLEREHNKEFLDYFENDWDSAESMEERRKLEKEKIKIPEMKKIVTGFNERKKEKRLAELEKEREVNKNECKGTRKRKKVST